MKTVGKVNPCRTNKNIDNKRPDWIKWGDKASPKTVFVLLVLQ